MRRFFPDEDPVGKRFRVGPPGPKEWWVEIVGVTGDMHRHGLERAVVPEYFTAVVSATTNQLIVRTGGNPIELTSAVHNAIRSVSSEIMILGTTTMRQHVDELSAERRFQTGLLALFAGLALLLATVGIYGLMHYAVAQRTQEFGIRMVLGARGVDVVSLVLDHALKLTLLGIGLGLTGAFWLTRVLDHLLFETSATDPLTFAAVAVLLTAIATVASYLPALRATRVDPNLALRAE